MLVDHAWTVVLHEEVSAWLQALTAPTRNRVSEAIDVLAMHGPGLGRPLVDTISGSRYANMKELRVGTCRLLFAFDRHRSAVVLVAGDKRDEWNRWYRVAIPLADRRLDEWNEHRERD